MGEIRWRWNVDKAFFIMTGDMAYSRPRLSEKNGDERQEETDWSKLF